MKQLIGIVIFLAGILHAQNTIAEDAPIVGTWNLSSPKSSPGPEFIPDSYKGINTFTINAGQNESTAEGAGKSYFHSLSFMAEWDGKKLTGKVTRANWTDKVDQLNVSVPFEYDPKKKQVIIHINNPEYGDVKFVFLKTKW